MSSTENHLKTGGEKLNFQNAIEITNKIAPECLESFQKMKIRRAHRYVVFKLGEEAVELERVGKRDESYETFKKSLPFSECRYCIYDQDYKTNDGRPASKLWFISWFPSAATTYHKMAYTSGKTSLREAIEGVFDLQCASTEELDSGLGLAEEEEEDDNDFDF